jgi:hypothetical protein
MRAAIATILMACGAWSVSPAWAAQPDNVKEDSAARADGGNRNDAWRFKFHQGRWWYWLPSNHWAVYENGRWLMPPSESPASANTSRANTAAKSEESGSFAEDYPAGPAGPEDEGKSAGYYLSVGGTYSKHAHEHAEILERYAGSGETVPAKIVKEQAQAIHRDVEQAEKSFSKLTTAANDPSPVGETISKLQEGLRQVTETLKLLEKQVQRQGAVQATLVRAQTAIIDNLLTQAHEAARAAEEEQTRREQDEKDRAGID